MKGKRFTQKETYRKMAMIADERQQKLRDVLVNVTKTWEDVDKTSDKKESLPIRAIHAAFDGEEYENMRPFCTVEEYALFAEAVLVAIGDFLPEKEICKIKKTLQG